MNKFIHHLLWSLLPIFLCTYGGMFILGTNDIKTTLTLCGIFIIANVLGYYERALKE